MSGPAYSLHVIIPSYGRPQHVARTAEAFLETGALTNDVQVTYALDVSDPQLAEYVVEVGRNFGARAVYVSESRGMVAAINGAGRSLPARSSGSGPYAIAVLNDDHVPRTPNWHNDMVDTLHTMGGTGIVYGDDLLRGAKLPTAWAMTSNIVEALGRVVPCLVEHLYADDAIMHLGQEAFCLAYLPSVVIEHVHPLAGKTETDAGYQRVNSRERKHADRARFLRWQASARCREQVATVRALMAGAR